MKLISVNTWGGRMMDPFKEFLTRHSDTDIFCFQEVYHDAHGKDTLWVDGSNFNLLDDIKKTLPEYDFYYRAHLGDWWGLAIFIKKNIDVFEEGEHFVHKFIGHDPAIEIHGHTAKNIQFLRTLHNDKPLTILNFHGLWNGKGKADTEDRINQSKKIIEFIRNIEGGFVFCGDFNLMPDTESLQMIVRELGCRDLIKEAGITSTRTVFYKKPDKFADYMFVSKEIEIKDFKVLSDEISDHKPLLLEI